MTDTATIASELKVAARQVAATFALLDEGATVPFIARYRKEVAGSLDKLAISTDRLTQPREMEKRREAVPASLVGPSAAVRVFQLRAGDRKAGGPEARDAAARHRDQRHRLRRLRGRGLHQDGLVHVSQLADRFVRDPHEAVKVRQPVKVTVPEVDMARRRIALSMRSQPEVGGERGRGNKT